MGQVNIPIMNPLRFENGSLPDYNTLWPNPDNVRTRVEYQKGMYAADYFKDFVINRQISLQFWIIPTVTDQNITVFKYNESTGIFDNYATVTKIDITPDSFISASVNQYDWTPTTSGLYYMVFTEPGYQSDYFLVHESEKYLKRLVEIEYYNTVNDYGMIYFSDEGDPDNFTQRFTGRTYFTGRFKTGDPASEISVFNRDRGGIVQTRATPLRTGILQLFDIHYTQIDMITHIFSNDTIIVNGINYNNSEPPQREEIEKSDLVNLTINLTQTENDYFVNL